MSTLHEFAKEVATHLGIMTRSVWELKTEPEAESWRAYIDGPNSSSLFFSNTWAGPGRIEVSGRYPHNNRVRTPDYYKITVADTRAALEVAKEIKRRLLPEYLPALADFLARDKADKDYENAKWKLASGAEELLGLSCLKDINSFWYVGPNAAKLSVRSEELLELEHVQVTLAQLKKIKRAVPELFRKES